MDYSTQVKFAYSALDAARHAVNPEQNGLLDRADLVRQIETLMSSLDFLLRNEEQERQKLAERLTRRISVSPTSSDSMQSVGQMS